MTQPTNRLGALFSLFLVLLIGGLLWLFNAAEDYFTFTADTAEAAASTAALDKESVNTLLKPTEEKFNTEVKYRTFYLTVPSAKKVELAADFNRFGRDPIVLKSYPKGYFETSVALTSGEYKYYFLVDGQKVLDPTNMDRQLFEDEEVCIKTVR